MKTGDSASPGSAIKLHGIVSYLIIPLKMFIYGKKEENNLRRCSLEFAKIIICQKKKKMIATICHSEICFDEPAVLEQQQKLLRVPVQAVLCVQLYTGVS